MGRHFFLFLPFGLLLFCKPLLAQAPCDTSRISRAISHARECLDEGKLQAALDTILLVLNDPENCSENSKHRESVLLQADACYQALAVDYLQRSLFNLSIDMSERSIALHRQMTDKYPDRLAKAYLNLGSAQNLNGNPKLAIEFSTKGLNIRHAANPKDLKIAAHYDQLASFNLALNDTVNVRLSLQKWDDFHYLLGNRASLQAKVNLANYWSMYYELKGILPLAIKILEDTLSRYGDILKAKGGFLGTVEFRLCELYTQTGNYKKALVYADKNIALFEARLQQQRGKLFSCTHYAWCLAQASRAAWKEFVLTKDTSWYNLAEHRCRQSEEVIFSMRDRPPNDGFRDWIANEVGIVANIAEVRQGMFAHTQEINHVERAFECIEASKSFAVQEFLHETYALQWAGLPDSLYQKENNFRTAVNDLETNFFMVRKLPNADSLISANDQELFALRDQYRDFLQDLEKSHPEYFRLKYNQPKASVQAAQRQMLSPGQCLLDLFIENGLVFALLIRPDTVVWLATPFDSAQLAAIQMLETESHLFSEYLKLPEKEYLQKIRSFADAAHLAYQILIAPVRPLLTEELLLILRDELVGLPFGALLSQPETNLSKPFLWHFLEKELVMSQVYSAGLFEFVQNRPAIQKPSGTVLGVAPFFEGEISSKAEIPVGDMAALSRSEVFKPLPGSGTEVQSIVKLTNGQSLVGAAATKSNFLKNCQQFNTLHLATHSAANEVLGAYSFVAFQSETDAKSLDLLYARDIYGLRLSADLVVLSACETALGQFRKDEGMVGLTRAFNCAGARNVVASLWSVDDLSTKYLMVLFYEEIQKGRTYNHALANAKRTLINEHRAYAHPFYWAGFVLNGR
ncbi:MAG: CHAT domain-containing protein [Saprospiraceae bacterium]